MSAIESGVINIRRMTRSDIDAVFALIYKTTKERRPLSRKVLSAACDPGEPVDLSFVAVANGQIIGFILATVEHAYIPFAEVCLIHAVIVDPEYEQRKVCSELINELSVSCNLQEINTIRSLVLQDDNEFRAFLEIHGFHTSDMTIWDKTFEPWIEG